MVSVEEIREKILRLLKGTQKGEIASRPIEIRLQKKKKGGFETLVCNVPPHRFDEVCLSIDKRALGTSVTAKDGLILIGAEKADYMYDLLRNKLGFAEVTRPG